MSFVKYSAVPVLVFVFYCCHNYFLFEDNFSEVRDVTGNIESIFLSLDTDSNGVLTLQEFLNLKNSYTVLQKYELAAETNYIAQEFPYLDIQLGEQVINIEAHFQPLILNSLKKNISDISEDDRRSLEGLFNWKSPLKERHPFGAKSFSVFLPKKADVRPGFTWWIIDSKTNQYSRPLSNRRYFPPKVDQNLLVLHALLSLFHPHPFLWTRFSPQGTAAVIHAIEDDFYYIVFRMHVEFQLSKPPLHPFWFTPSQFQGRLIINKDGTVVKFFDMEVPNTKLNVDMEWYNGPSEDSMEVDIGYIPQMSLISTAISVPSETERGATKSLSSIKWTEEISMEEAQNILERQFFPFKQIKYYNLSEAFEAASHESKLVHGILLWGNLADQSC